MSWVGYFQQGTLSEMTFTSVNLDEYEGVFIAQGYDQCGNFRFQGTIRNDDFKAVKHYPNWNIYYMGKYNKDPQEIIGFWGFTENQPQQPFKILRANNNKIQEFRTFIQETNASLR